MTHTLDQDLKIRFAGVVLEERLLRAVEQDDIRLFLRLAEQLPGGLTAAQALVRARGTVVRPTSIPIELEEDD